jgi:hypothetical protein
MRGRRGKRSRVAAMQKALTRRVSGSLDRAAHAARRAGARIRGRTHRQGSRRRAFLRTAGAVAGGVMTVALMRRGRVGGR